MRIPTPHSYAAASRVSRVLWHWIRIWERDVITDVEGHMVHLQWVVGDAGMGNPAPRGGP